MLKFLSHLTGRKTPRQPQITTMFSPGMHTWKRGEIVPQEYFTFRNGLWHPVEGPQTSDSDLETATPARALNFSVLSWNIDFMRAEDDARMAAAHNHLHTLVSARPNHPSVILLNEMTKSDLALIKQADWVRAGYHMTDVSPAHWESPAYGKGPPSLPFPSPSAPPPKKTH
jgi:tyrosyl-DNA phosphodiesterase 2